MATDSNELTPCKYYSSYAVIKHGTRNSKSSEIRQRYLCCICNRTLRVLHCGWFFQ